MLLIAHLWVVDPAAVVVIEWIIIFIELMTGLDIVDVILMGTGAVGSFVFTVLTDY